MGPHLGTARRGASARQPLRDDAWSIVVAAAKEAEAVSRAKQRTSYALDNEALRQVAVADPDAVLAWNPGMGWETALPADDPRHSLIDLYLPICSATRTRPVTVGHLGQSLDGFIATHAGESQY